MFAFLVCCVCVVVLFVAASALSLFESRRALSSLLYKVCAAFMVLSLVVKGVWRENMLSDAALVPVQMWLRAVLAMTVCVALGVLFAAGVKAVRKRNR